MTEYLKRFTFVGNGIWKHETYSIMLNEDYKKTFRAYRYNRPLWRFVAKNANGNPIRFRSAEAAAKWLFKKPTDASEHYQRGYDDGVNGRPMPQGMMPPGYSAAAYDYNKGYTSGKNDASR